MSTKHHERPEGPSSQEFEKEQVPPAKDAGQAAAQSAPLEADSQGKDASSRGNDDELAALKARVAALEAANAALTEENSSLKDQYLRKLADYENFRKRMFREKDDALKFANTGLLTDFISVLDDFDRAIGSAEHTQDYKTLHDGVGMIKRQMLQLLSGKYGLSVFGAVGEVFDPNIHEAVASEPGEGDESLVTQQFLPGYKLHERVIRSAKVKVSMPSARNAADAAGASAGAGQKAAEEAAQAK
jgi:molecular chaperone GrpE